MKTLICLVLVLGMPWAGFCAEEWEMHWLKGLQQQQERQYAEAIDEFSEAIRLIPESEIDAHTSIWYDRGMNYDALNQHEKALEDFDFISYRKLPLETRLRVLMARHTVLEKMMEETRIAYRTKYDKDLEARFPEIEFTETGVALKPGF